jgi:protein-L-isoaspartate(D-aspartate) O-methyltransferase
MTPRTGVEKTDGDALERRLRTNGVADERVLSALRAISRQGFIPPGHALDTPPELPIAIGPGITIPPIPLVATMLQGLSLTGSERVLEVGTGSGYQAALLGTLAHEVYSLEVDAELVDKARHALYANGCTNVQVLHGDGSRGWPAAAPYQAIIVNGGSPDVPLELLEQLDDGGRLVIPVGADRQQLVERLQRRGLTLDTETLCSANLEPLPGRQQKPSHVPWARANTAAQ